MSVDRTARPRRLGKGIADLINAPVELKPNVSMEAPARATMASASATPSPSVPSDSSAPTIQFIATVNIQPNPFQPRKQFSQESLRDLTRSIQQAGILQPVLLRPHRQTPGEFELVAGERRWRAAQLCGLQSIPAIISTLSDVESAEWALIENVQREDLNAMDRADALRALSERFELTNAQVAERLGMDRSTVANLVRLTELEPQIREWILNGALSAGHGKALLQMQAGTARVRLAQRATEEQWSVRRLEQATRPSPAAPVGPTSPGRMLTSEEARRKDLERQIGDYLGTKVTLKSSLSGQRGRVVLEFYGLEHFDGLLARMGFKPH